MRIARDDLPRIPNDPAHPLRPFVFMWTGSQHLDSRTWYGERTRDEFHGIKRIKRFPRRSSWPTQPRKGERVVKHNELVYVFDDDPKREEVSHKEMITRLRERHGEYVGNVKQHPLVLAWENGDAIEFSPSEPAFPMGSQVRDSYSDLPDDLVKGFRELDGKSGSVGRVVGGNALFVQVAWKGGTNWRVARLLELVEQEVDHGE